MQKPVLICKHSFFNITENSYLYVKTRINMQNLVLILLKTRIYVQNLVFNITRIY